ncbi:MAG: BMP family ABC transporter substrate-binding protein [Rhodospirillales bacterium]|nr:BMP family ABC transporter substrate-binding protein [Rhodospirillales bacterium]MCY4004566.1 BMP family ABC transporter substrate-binding protein [Rhodospirillales bacterium]MCY4096825.1 BMP family ABC transporter substrate-binding protein [Rhodospirillales bacterium]
MKYQNLAAIILILAGCSAHAADIKPGVVYDLGGKFDKSFNEGVWNGAKRFTADTGIEFQDFEVQTDSQRAQVLRTFARGGYDPILAVGFQYASALERIAAEFPETRFAIIDSEVHRPNVQSIVFREHEGAFVVGVLAAMASRTGKLGFVGGMDVPLIRRFACGYVLGAQHASPGVEIFQNMVGTTGAAWNDPVKGAELARSQFDRGADVIFHAAGTTGLGVLQAAADADMLGIGVDSNQNHLHPGSVLTSMLKRVDVVAYEVFDSARQGTWTAGVRELGLKEGGVGWALDEFNEGLVSPEMKAAADRAAADIKRGNIRVHDYVADGHCPAD